MITREIITEGLRLGSKEQSLKNQLKEVSEEIDLFFNGIPKEDLFELLLTWKDVNESMQVIAPIDRSDYEYEPTDGSDTVLHAIWSHSDNFPEVQRVLEEFGYSAIEDNSGGILLWETGGVVVPMRSSFHKFILIFKEPRTGGKIITDYSPSLFQVRYKKVIGELK